MKIRDASLYFYIAMVATLVCLQQGQSVTQNCKTQQCVQVADTPDSLGRNTTCWITVDGALSYSTTYAITGYGQDSLGGTAMTNVMGFVRGVSTFKAAPCLADILPATGTVTGFGTGKNAQSFNTICSGS